MESYFKEIKKKIRDQIVFEEFEIIDNTKFHRGHKFFNPKKYHLKLKIRSSYLRNLPKIQAQRLIFKILKDDLERKIHALEIKIS